MHPRQTLTLALLTLLLVGLGAFAAGYSVGTGDAVTSVEAVRSQGDVLRVVEDALRSIEENAVRAPDHEALARGAVRGMVQVFRRNQDPYALFFTPKGYRSFQELTTGRFSGIGVWLKDKGGKLHVISVLPQSPAQRSGLQRDDIISSIDGRAVDTMTIDEAVTRIKGPEGTEVSLQIERRAEKLTFRITRARLELPNLIARTAADGDFGYIRLFGFARGAARQTRRELQELRAAGVDGIVLDLRDNGGGLFTEAIDVASLFIERGLIVSYMERSSPEVTYDAKGDAFDHVPLVVLVNEGTASASEIVAGALQDRDRAIVVGSQTYGKGSVQEIVPLADSSALKLTTGTYVTPSGRRINGKGIRPDIEVTARPAMQRRRAFEILKGIVVSGRSTRG